MSIVPPARSIRVGAEDTVCTRGLYESRSQIPNPQSRIPSSAGVRLLAAITVEFECVSPTMLRRQIGQLLIAGFNGHQLPVELKAIVREFGLGGVILFARNIAEPEQVAELCAEASRLVPDLPLWVSVDQEGG